MVSSILKIITFIIIFTIPFFSVISQRMTWNQKMMLTRTTSRKVLQTQRNQNLNQVHQKNHPLRSKQRYKSPKRYKSQKRYKCQKRTRSSKRQNRPQRMTTKLLKRLEMNHKVCISINNCN